MMARFSFALYILMLPLAAYCQTAAELYQAGLTAEKGEGDLHAAAKSYAAVVERYRQGAAAADLAARAQERLGRVQRHLGLEAVASEPIPSRPPGFFGKGLELTGRLQVLHHSLGLRGLLQRPSGPDPSADKRSVADLWYPSWGRSLERMYTLDPLALTRGQARLVFLAEPLDACRVFLGFEGLPEQLAQIRRQRPQPRVPTPTELYLSALFLEKERTDVRRAVRLYERLLQNQGVSQRLHRLARMRLDRCRQRLGRTGRSSLSVG